MNLNKSIITGNLARNVSLRQTNGGTAVCDFTVAVNRPKAKEGTQSADFIDVQAWGKLAESCARYLAKGSKVAVEGRLVTNSYENKDGVKMHSVKISAYEVEFLSPKAADQAPDPAGPTEVPEEFTEVFDSELPF